MKNPPHSPQEELRLALQSPAQRKREAERTPKPASNEAQRLLFPPKPPVAKQDRTIRKVLANRAAELEAEAKAKEAAIVLAERAQLDLIERGYMAGRLVQCTFPHKNPGNVPFWVRRNDDVELLIRPLVVGTVEAPEWHYPYGTIPRLLMYWVVTESVQKKSQKLYLGENVSQFMRSIGLDPRGGGEKSPRQALKDMMPRLFRSVISVEEIGKREQKWLDMQVAQGGNIWWKPEGRTSDGGWQGFIELNDRFFKHITLGPQPLNIRHLTALRESCLALDLYALLTNRAFKAWRTKESILLPWKTLESSLGAEYERARDFRAAVCGELARVLEEIPSLKVEIDPDPEKGGLIVDVSKPEIPPK